MLGGTWPRAVMSAASPSRPCRLLRAVDMLDLQPDHFAGTQAASIAKTECRAGLEACGNGQHATRLVRTHHLRNLLGLADVIDIGRELQPPQCHAQQKLHPGHDTVAIADAHARLGKMQLKTGGCPPLSPCRGTV